MEETLGKRIAHERKKLGITQERLAEQLGVTAQAVSKWENDQSCPDITMLPKLAEIFGVSTDALLGLGTEKAAPVFEAEVVSPSEPVESNNHKASWDFEFYTGRRGNIALALWILLVGGLLLASNLLDWEVGLWDILWPSCPLVYGLCGLAAKFSVFNLGCTLFGGYFLLSNLNVLQLDLNKQILLPVFLLLFGLSLLLDTFRKPRRHELHINRKGSSGNRTSTNFNLGEDTFVSDLSFGGDAHCVNLPLLRGGRADVSFGELTVDLSGCQEIADRCEIEVGCSFGELNLRVPRRYRVESHVRSSFGAVETDGNPDANAVATITLEGSVSFGELSIHYI